MREKIMDAATTLFSQKGYYETSMDDVAQLAGVAKGSLYYHFKNKSQLFCDTALYGLRFISDQVRRIVNEDSPPRRTAERIVGLFVDICVDYTGLTDMIMNELSAGIDGDVLQTVRQAKLCLLDDVVRVLDEGMGAGVIRPFDSRCAAAALVSFVYAYCRQAFSVPGAERRAVAAEICGVLLRGMLA